LIVSIGMSDATALPTIDTRVLLEMQALGDEQAVLGDILQLFREDLPGHLAGLWEGVSAEDRPAIERAAHSLRGSGGQLGLARVHAAAAALEDAAHGEPMALVRQRAASMESELRTALDALALEVRQMQTPGGTANRLGAPHVLVVDDERHIARFVQFVLSGAGYDVSCVHGGPEALEAVAQRRPDAIVLDLMMPGMSGFEVLERLRRTGAPLPPTVVLTARADATTADEVCLAGASAHCAKPVAPTTLLETLLSLGVSPVSGGHQLPGLHQSQQTEAGMVAEVAIGWEALEALYDVAATGVGLAGAEAFAEALVDRFRRVQPGLEAALWVEGYEGERWGLPSADPGCGLVGLAVSAGSSVVLEGKALADVAGLEREVRRAHVALAAPFATPSGLRGALLAWRDHGGIDTRLTRLAESLAWQAAAWFENSRLRDAERERERLEQDLAIAARIQRTLLCSTAPAGLAGLRCAALWKPSQGVGGDFIDFIPLSRGRLDVLVGDVMGKGMQAALLGAATKHHLLRSFASSSAHAAPDLLVQDAHERIFAELVALDSFVTLCYARFDPAEQVLLLVDAGHTRTLLLHDGRCQALSGSNLPLGFRAGEHFEAIRVPTRPGDVLLFYSDGVTEARDGEGRALGEDWLARWLEANGTLAPSELLAALAVAIDQWSAAGGPQDDITAACVRVEQVR
jgi:serine phosphatase RsbU (regulator of sigma subunit)/ActR/RegA family two-component response regulator/HPt (histidine-containing phosphotransfer) domain-containing protein